MFELIRRNQRILQFLLLLLIFPAFAFFGISGYNTFFVADDSVAKVGELNISRADFENARQGQINNMRRMFGDQIDPTALDTPQMRAELLDNLINQRLLASEAGTKRVVVPDAAITSAIEQMPDFKDANGQFDFQKYTTLLEGAGMSSAQYENRMRVSMTLGAIPDSIERSAFVPRTVSRQLVKLQQQKRKYRARSFKPEDYIKKVQVTPDQARAFYDENKKLFESPESVKIEYLVLSADELGKAATVTADDLQKYYDEHKTRYMNPERRKVSHILLNRPEQATPEQQKVASDKADALLKQLRGGEDFAALAKTQSQDPGSAENGGDLGFITRTTISEAFANAAFSLEKNGISDVVQTEAGLHIIKVTEIEAASGMGFAEAKTKIEPELRKSKGREAYLAAADTFNDTVYEQPDSLAPAAEKLKLTVQTLDALTRFGAADLSPDSPLRNPKVLRALFTDVAISKKENIEAVEASDGVLVSARVIEHRPAAIQDFDKVEAEATAQLSAREAARLAKEAGQAELTKLKAGAALEKFEDEQETTRDQSGLAVQASQALFAAPGKQLPQYLGVALGNSGYSILQLTAVNDASEADIDKALDGINAQTGPAQGRQALESFVEALKKRIPVERNEALLAPVPADG